MRGIAIDCQWERLPQNLFVRAYKSRQGKYRTDYTLTISLYFFGFKLKIKDHRRGQGFREKPKGLFIALPNDR